MLINYTYEQFTSFDPIQHFLNCLKPYYAMIISHIHLLFRMQSKTDFFLIMFIFSNLTRALEFINSQMFIMDCFLI